ncbi:MAG: hypothetical protein KGK30_09685, partial [Elusimicrobia bacterium]|nr:hypothetical protein [Elusimicrobiota bacterium]
MSRRLLLGADLGGTWLRLCLADDSGRFLRRVRVGAVPWPQAPARIAALLKRWNNPKLSWLLLGGKGLRGRREQKALRRALRGLADRIVVISDLELSHRAAFRGGTGVLLIAGTGSSALGRDRKGRWRYAGGWGPLLGDEGSAFWIGKEALKDSRLSRSWPAELPLRLARHPNPVRATAALARRVLKLAERGDPAAAALR